MKKLMLYVVVFGLSNGLLARKVFLTEIKNDTPVSYEFDQRDVVARPGKTATVVPDRRNRVTWQARNVLNVNVLSADKLKALASNLPTSLRLFRAPAPCGKECKTQNVPWVSIPGYQLGAKVPVKDMCKAIRILSIQQETLNQRNFNSHDAHFCQRVNAEGKVGLHIARNGAALLYPVTDAIYDVQMKPWQNLPGALG